MFYEGFGEVLDNKVDNQADGAMDVNVLIKSTKLLYPCIQHGNRPLTIFMHFPLLSAGHEQDYFIRVRGPSRAPRQVFPAIFLQKQSSCYASSMPVWGAT